jgi:hypothetical protein
MSAFTTTLKKAIGYTGGTVQRDTVSFDGIVYGSIPVVTGGDIGLGDYPIFDENYRNILNGKIIDHYWNREIGSETVEMFQHFMRRTMNEIMPYYNQLYISTRMEFQPLITMSLETKASGTRSEDANTTANNSSTNQTNAGARVVSSQTPQTMLRGDEDYASSGTDTNSQQTGTTSADNNSETKVNANDTTDSVVSGYQGLPSDLIMRYRESFLNIDVNIIEAIEDCFMLIWDTTDEYFGNRYYYL